MAKHPRTDTEPPERDPYVAPRLEPVPSDPEPKPAPPRAPSRRLMLAVLADAIATFRRSAVPITRQDERDFVEIVHWFASEDDTGRLSFRTICRALELDADALRAGLKAVRARARAGQRARVLH